MRCPFATWRGDVPNETRGGMIAHRGLVLHVQQGQEAGTDSWFHNPQAQASAHFGVGTDGHLDQWVDTDDKAWAEAAGNPYWVSVEIAGYSGQAATGPQVAALGRLYRWGANTYGWPPQATDDPSGAGLGWHGMGGRAWGGHLDCPGEPIKRQRAAILAAAAGAAPTEEDIIVDDSTRRGLVRLTYLAVYGDDPTGPQWDAGDAALQRNPNLDAFVSSIADSPSGQAARRARNPQPHP